VQEIRQKMDVYANDVLSRYSSKVDLSVAWLPRKWKPYYIPENCPVGRYTLLYDPIGSSNTDTNLSLGSICHSPTGREIRMVKRLIYSRWAQTNRGWVHPLWSQHHAGSIGKGVHSFTLDPSLGLSFGRKYPNSQPRLDLASMRATSGNGMNQSNTSAMSTAQKAIPL